MTLQAHLDSVLDGYYGIDGSLACADSGPIGRGSALTCQRSYADGPGWVPPDVAVLVAVLDDTGRYTFTVPGEPYAAPGDYPAGTISCRTLIAPPDPSDRQTLRGLSYPALLHYWMSMGSPSSMDDDANGWPCETVYPADVVARAAASPLVPRTGASPREVTLQDVRAHAEAVISGLSGGEIWLGEELTRPDGDWVHVPGTYCSSDEAARTGSTLLCAIDNDVPGWAAQAFQVYISILDDAGRYALAWQCCCMECPNLSQYPPDSTCDDLSQAPRGEEGQYGREGTRYGHLLYRWMTLGRPGDWDSDGDGRPCEDHWPVDEIDRVMSSTLRP